MEFHFESAQPVYDMPPVLRLLDYIQPDLRTSELHSMPVLLPIYNIAMYLPAFSRNFSFELIDYFLCSPNF